MTLMRLVLAASALLFAAGPAAADEGQPTRAHELAPAREAAWIAAVQNLKTDDGTTVLQALRSAEELRPSEFKFGDFGAGYDGASGEPEGVAIDFWIGAKREPDESFGILFDVKDQDGEVTVARPKSRNGGTAAEAIVSGRDELLRFIDRLYRENCTDPDTGGKRC